jgi:hypothetical protein
MADDMLHYPQIDQLVISGKFALLQLNVSGHNIPVLQITHPEYGDLHYVMDTHSLATLRDMCAAAVAGTVTPLRHRD